jgi:hypothetical protein
VIAGMLGIMLCEMIWLNNSGIVGKVVFGTE